MENSTNNQALVPADENNLATELQTKQQFTAIDNIIKAELDNQITTARAFPRDITAFLRKAVTLATLDVETAEACIYALPRQGKVIEGPSVRLAEIVFSTYGNLRAGSQVISNDGKKIISRGFCHDLESNVSVSMEVTRRITDKNGRTYNDDMQVVTGNAANAISFRNAIFKVVPMAITKGIYTKVKDCIRGAIKDISTRREQAMKYFEDKGIKRERVFETIGVKGIEGIGEDELITLIGFVNALKNGETTIEECFPEHKPESSKAKAAEQAVLDGIGKQAGKDKK